MVTEASRLRLRVRAGLLVVIAAFMLLSPLHRVLGGRSPYLRDWVLYRDLGVGLVDAEFFVDEVDVDRFAALRLARGPSTSELLHIRGEAGLHGLCRRLCAALGPGTDLRVRARLATVDGWVVIDDGSINRCGPARARPIIKNAAMRELHD